MSHETEEMTPIARALARADRAKAMARELEAKRYETVGRAVVKAAQKNPDLHSLLHGALNALSLSRQERELVADLLRVKS